MKYQFLANFTQDVAAPSPFRGVRKDGTGTLKMMNSFRHWLGGGTSSGNSKQGSRDQPQTGFDDGSDSSSRRQLVQMLLRDAMRRHGVPAHWIECQTLTVASRSRGPGMYVRLVMRHWDQRLMAYAYAIQNVLLQDVADADPKAPEWLHGISWQLDFDQTCPYQDMPEKTFWLAPSLSDNPDKAPTTSAEGLTAMPRPSFQDSFAPTQPASIFPGSDSAGAEDEAMQDLARLFLIRDQELAKNSDASSPIEPDNAKPPADRRQP
jgi:hypothetical protein